MLLLNGQYNLSQVLPLPVGQSGSLLKVYSTFERIE
jgi:hypothetical protein